MSGPLKTAAGVCVVRDAVDLIPFLCGHYLRMGFSHLAFVDDGSSDGTFETLAWLAARTGRISVRQVRNDVFSQQSLVTDAANRLLADGYRLIVPFDADEFWTASAREFGRLSGDFPEAAFRGRWVNFVQARSCEASGASALLRMTYRAADAIEEGAESITAYKGSFVCCREIKVAFQTSRPVQLDTGQHKVIQGPSPVPGPPSLEIFHLPLRAKAEIAKRGLNYEPRRSAIRSDKHISWQSVFHREVVTTGRTDSVWAANSFDRNGVMDVYGRPVQLVRDLRLRRLLLQAAWHLVSRYRVVPFFRGRAHKTTGR